MELNYQPTIEIASSQHLQGEENIIFFLSVTTNKLTCLAPLKNFSPMLRKGSILTVFADMKVVAGLYEVWQKERDERGMGKSNKIYHSKILN